MASSSSSSTRHWKYDVFLSFRGPDTRKAIAVELHNRLNRSGIKTFIDNSELRVGDTISPTLIQAIKDSRFAIVLLSQNYASSTWCLEELGEICLSMEDNRILPVFYEVEPTDVRHQKRKFEEAFSEHELCGRHESEKVKQWRADLKRVANICGWNTADPKFNTYSDLIDDIVESLRKKVQLNAIESTGEFQVYEATTQAMDKVKKALANDEITAVGVYGMGGVGKTSMVKHVAAQACKNCTFNHWIIAAISQTLDLEKIQSTFADFLKFEFKEKTEAGRAARLHREIMNTEKLLIIVDDVWERTNLSRIGIPSYKQLQMRKSKVLFTTRRLNICNAMNCHEKIALNVLSEKDSWTLFQRTTGTIPLESTTFETVARRVAAECKGLPIALVVVARALKDEDIDEWEKAAVRLKNSQPANPNHEGDEENAFRCIRLSYDYLKNEDHKSFFLLCCLFPEDHDIRLEDLYKYAFGIGLFGVAETTIEEARGAVDSVVKFLKGSSLLLDGKDKGCVKMHDVIRDTALNIAQSGDGRQFWVKAGCGLEEWPPRGLPKGCTAISVMRNQIRKLPEEELVCPNLQILLLNQNSDLDEIPEKFIKNLSLLRVLDLSNTKISVLPQSFSLLTNLQALYLDECMRLIDISMVGSLKKLEILSMRKYSLSELSREIGHLTNLRILDVSNYYQQLIIPSQVISKLQKLQELHIMNYAYDFWGNIKRGFARLSSLKILPNLEKLRLEYVDELEYVFRFEGFEPEQPKLREMHLDYLKALKSICNGPAPHAMFQSLKILSIFDCDLLQSVFTSDVSQCLVQLEDLLVEWCPRLERVIEAVNNEKTVLPKLKNLVLRDLPMLYGPSATTVDIECPSLEHLIVVDCTHISFSTSFGYLYFFSESRNGFSKYFGSRNIVQLNDYALYERLHRRLGG